MNSVDFKITWPKNWTNDIPYHLKLLILLGGLSGQHVQSAEQMNIMLDRVFLYPTQPHCRKHGPRGYTDFHSFKPWLRDEFCFRCVYCLIREIWLPNGQDYFSVEHLSTKSQYPDLECEYDNLLYVCCRCNTMRGISAELPSPCEIGYGQFLRIDENGEAVPLAREGERVINILRLDHPTLTRWRQQFLELMESAQESSIVSSLLGLPTNLPDLTVLKPPLGNSRPEGVSHSFFARRTRGEMSPPA